MAYPRLPENYATDLAGVDPAAGERLHEVTPWRWLTLLMTADAMQVAHFRAACRHSCGRKGAQIAAFRSAFWPEISHRIA